MSKYTEGPWKQNRYNIETETKKSFISLAFNVGVPSEECEANARLIAAAPELLKALTTMLEAVDKILSLSQQHDPVTGHYKMVDPFELLEILQRDAICLGTRAAVRKARGGDAC